MASLRYDLLGSQKREVGSDRNRRDERQSQQRFPSTAPLARATGEETMWRASGGACK